MGGTTPDQICLAAHTHALNSTQTSCQDSEEQKLGEGGHWTSVLLLSLRVATQSKSPFLAFPVTCPSKWSSEDSSGAEALGLLGLGSNPNTNSNSALNVECCGSRPNLS